MWWRSFYIFLGVLSRLGEGEILIPPYFNLAEGKEVIASATCGYDTPGPELYCKLVGANSDENVVDKINLIQGQVCDYCDPNIPEKNHPAEHAVDGTEKWWQSPPLSRGMKYNEVDFTINLGQEFHVAYVFLQMGNSPRPGLWILEKSKDYGETYTPWQYFAETDNDCLTYFGVDSGTKITRDDSVICTTKYSKIVPLEGGEMAISVLTNRPSSNHYFNSTVLQEWSRATNIRFRFLRTQKLGGHLMSVAGPDTTVTRRFFYSIKYINVGGRCMCNGHADTCDVQDPTTPKKLICRCQHNTCGSQCETCCKGFEQKKWRQSTGVYKFRCEPCNCHGHSDECVYDPEIDENHQSLDIHGNYEGGGVCQNCRDNTKGINCHMCKEKFYRPANKPLNASDVCKPCVCNPKFSTGNCQDINGTCECRPEFTPPNCDSCSYGYYGFPECKPCDCNLKGTDGYHCEAKEGECPCKPNYAGHYCDLCSEGYYDYPNCLPCDCNSLGSLHNVCDVESGNCSCKDNYAGRTCDVCENGYFQYPSCRYCDCDPRGTEPGICDKDNGKCLCKEGYGGPRCDQCVIGYYGYPNCKPCNCSTVGSSSIGCDGSGKCSCLVNFAGQTCNQCSPGYYKYPECISCNCNTYGAIGVSCDNEGKCQCRSNFDRDRCDVCKESFYNFPTCEECNCDPAGVVKTFQGCGSLPIGELCQCKNRVEGRICNQCKALYWNLLPDNPEGCQECECNVPGVIGSIGECDTKSGQCICKPSVSSRDCSECSEGSYNLRENNLFGCTECGCDIGGSVNPVCNKRTGQCSCFARITGQKCTEPMKAHYFPTLHQFQYEAEDGKTPHSNIVRFRYEEDVFPNYSWKGYAVFSDLQNKIIHDVDIRKSTLYRMILRYVNLNSEPVIGSIIITPDNDAEVEQEFKVLFKPTSQPSFVTVAGSLGNTPAVMVMNPGHWIITTAIDKSLFLDYFVLIPSEYYEATILTQDVTIPCEIGYQELCRHFGYPILVDFDFVMGANAYSESNDIRLPLTEYFTDREALNELGETELPLINNQQNKILFDLPISSPGLHVLVVTYVTPREVEETTKAFVSVNGVDNGTVTLYPCKYTSICRQVVTDISNKVAVMNLPGNNVYVGLTGETDCNVAIKSVVAIPVQQWSLDYLKPKSVCVRKNGECVKGIFTDAADAKKVEFETNNEELLTDIFPQGIYDNSSKLIYLPDRNPRVDIPVRVSEPGKYIFIVQYYQTDYPEFELDVLVQNGKTYEAKVPVPHCPSNSGCRSIIHQTDGNTQFQLIENGTITITENSSKGIWLDYILIIPADQYNEKILKKLQFDQTTEFIKKCGNNHFSVSEADDPFCRESVFSLTSNYNSGALQCLCDGEGSNSYVCEPFGGQCPCKPNIIGRQCSICKTGFFGFPNCKPCSCPSPAICEPDTGKCICPPRVIGDRCDQCQPNTYGFDDFNGCNECNCSPNGVLGRNLQCDLFTGDCQCKNNIVGRQCDKCENGYHHFPYCDQCNCDIKGTTERICNQDYATCECKVNVEGTRCDNCRDGTFDLQRSNEQGCTKCFCFKKTTRCESANLQRSFVYNMTDWEAVSYDGSIRTLNLQPRMLNETTVEMPVSFSDNDVDLQEDILYFAAPYIYVGNRLSSYGGLLNYTVHYTTNQDGNAVAGPDVILQSDDLVLIYNGDEEPPSFTNFRQSVLLVENNFETETNAPATREQFMTLLHNLRGIYIRASYWRPSVSVMLSDVVLDTAEEAYGRIPYYERVTSVEKCHCPVNYQGLSCEECAPGYYRREGPNGAHCFPCQCNNHADTCDVDTGVCLNCRDGTTGDHCEICQTGYYGNATIGSPGDCLICACPLPTSTNNFATDCEFSPDGTRISCTCLPGYYGARCESCAAGYYGDPETIGETCKTCKCSGNIDTNEIGSCDSVTGECLRCLNNTYGKACNLCKPGYFGDAIDRKDCQSCYCDKCGMKHCDNYNGICECHQNVIGEKCERCKDNHYGFHTCQGCKPCLCGLASESSQCDDKTGKCRCKPGVEGRICDQCIAGYWNYTSEGCTNCNCFTEYSKGISCDPITGQCICKKGVLGEKCDTCPDRHVFDENDGCLPCDTCVHNLLNDTDALEKRLNDTTSSFNDVQNSYFTTQHLKYVQDFYDTLQPKLTLLDSTKVHLPPLEDTVLELSENLDKQQLKIEYNKKQSIRYQRQADEVLNNVTGLQQDLDQQISFVRDTVAKVKSLATNMKLGTGPSVTAALQDAKDKLHEISSVSFTEQRDNATDLLILANVLLTETSNFSKPIDLLTHKLHYTRGQADNFSNLIDDIGQQVDHAENILMQTNKQMEMGKVGNSGEINNLLEVVEQGIQEGDLLLKKAEDLYNKALSNANNMTNDPNMGMDEYMELDNIYRSNNEELDKMSDEDLINLARQHADDLNYESQSLKDLLTDTRNMTGVRAASAFREIFDGIEAARLAVSDAKDATDRGNQTSKGLEQASQLSETGRQLYNRVNDAVRRINTQLDPTLKELINNAQRIAEDNKKLNDTLDQIDKSLKMANPVSSADKVQEVKEKTNNARYITENAMNGVQIPLNKIEENRLKAKNLTLETSDAKSSISQANNHLDNAQQLLPLINSKMDLIAQKVDNINRTNDHLKQKTDLLKMQIEKAREWVNKIKVGLTFFPNTTVELRNPENLRLLETSTNISFYFATRQPNSFLLYLGNEDSWNRSRSSMSDYMEVTLENGFPKLTIDLGSGPETLVNKHYAADGQWRQLIIDRVGRNVNLNVREEIPGTDSDEIFRASKALTKSSSIFNLDQDHSKLYVGGFPASSQRQNAKTESFDGQMEELVVGDTPVSLWNFVYGENNQQGTGKRDRLKNDQNPTGYRFTRGGYVILSKRNLEIQDAKRFSITMNIKTLANDGLIFLTESDDNSGHFLSLELQNGEIIFKFNLGDGIQSTKSYGRFNDGNWHKVDARRNGDNGRLTIDNDNDHIGVISGTGSRQTLISSDHMYFGGYPKKTSNSPVILDSFEGCIDLVVILTQYQHVIDLRKYEDALKIKPGCPPDKFENVVSFDLLSPGYVAWEAVTIQDNLQLDVKFKTVYHDGLIFHLENIDGTGETALFLENDDLILESQGLRINTSSSDFKFNDSKWHIVTISYDTRQLRLNVDDVSERTFDLPRMPTSIFDGNLTVGSLPNQRVANSKYRPFIGCIGDIAVNGVIFSFANSSMNYNAHLGQCRNVVKAPNADFGHYLNTEPPPLPHINRHNVTTNVVDVDSGSGEQQIPNGIEGEGRPQAPASEEETTSLIPDVTQVSEPVEGCKLPYHPGKDPNPENGWRFGTSRYSRIEYNTAPSSHRHKFEFQISVKTIEKEGIIFYASDPNARDLISVYIKNGQVHFKYDCGTGPALLVNKKMISDNQWHTIYFGRTEKDGELHVDDGAIVSGQSQGDAKGINVRMPFYVGGITQEISKHVSESIESNMSFNGCIADFVFNGVPMGEPTKRIGVTQCSKKIEPGAFFYPNNGTNNWIRTKVRFSSGKESSITMSIKPRSRSGVLLMAKRENSDNMILLEMIDGAIKFQFQSGIHQGMGIFPDKNQLCDGNWHTIIAVRNLHALFISVDGVQVTNKTDIISSLSIKNPIFIGGHPMQSSQRSHNIVGREQYIGCIKDVTIKDDQKTLLHFNQEQVHGQVSVGFCPTI